MTVLSAPQAYKIWAASYDSDPNPLLALEMRVLTSRLGNLAGCAVLDVATGTGRWMQYAASSGARVAGIDVSPQMLGVAAGKPLLSGRLILGDARALPFRSGSVDLAICSFALSYLPFATEAFAEMARVARRIVVSDLHPEAVSRGWNRSFRSAGETWNIEHDCHSLDELNQAARAAGMALQWTVEATFGLPERHFFELAGKPALFEEVRYTPAVLAASWTRDLPERIPCA